MGSEFSVDTCMLESFPISFPSLSGYLLMKSYHHKVNLVVFDFLFFSDFPENMNFKERNGTQKLSTFIFMIFKLAFHHNG